MMVRMGVTIGLLLAVCSSNDAQTKRRVFVLHSGMHIILAASEKNQAALSLKANLSKRGVPERDLIVMESPYPNASWSEMVPRGGLVIYLESTDPKSRSSQDAYLRLHKALQVHGVTPKDDIVWIGHSAGGQMGMTMAHLAHNLDKFPELAKKTQVYRFDTVITIGSAVGSNPVPADVKLRHYYSAGDTMVYFLSTRGNVVSESMKSRVRFQLCCDLGPNAKVRVFPDIEHSDWDSTDEVLKCMLQEFGPNICPAWRKAHADLAPGVGLSQLIARTLEAELKISLQEHRR